MTDVAIFPLLMLLAGTCLFMAAGIAVCISLSIFCDVLNLGGAFEKVGATAVALFFVPILLAGNVLDVITNLFLPEKIKRSLRPPTVSKETSTITV